MSSPNVTSSRGHPKRQTHSAHSTAPSPPAATDSLSAGTKVSRAPPTALLGPARTLTAPGAAESWRRDGGKNTLHACRAVCTQAVGGRTEPGCPQMEGCTRQHGHRNETRKDKDAGSWTPNREGLHLGRRTGAGKSGSRRGRPGEQGLLGGMERCCAGVAYGAREAPSAQAKEWAPPQGPGSGGLPCMTPPGWPGSTMGTPLPRVRRVASSGRAQPTPPPLGRGSTNRGQGPQPPPLRKDSAQASTARTHTQADRAREPEPGFHISVSDSLH